MRFCQRWAATKTTRGSKRVSPAAWDSPELLITREPDGEISTRRTDKDNVEKGKMPVSKLLAY